MINVVARSFVKKGMEAEYIKHAEKAVAETRKEKGCILYQACQNNDDPLQFAMVENWESKEALDAHMQTAHFNEFRVNTADIVVDRSIDVYTVVK